MRNARTIALKAAGGRSAGTERRKRRSAAEIKARILQAATKEFNAKGFAGATTAAIAKRADVAEMQMFRYFPSKTDLFREAIFAPLSVHFRAFIAKHSPEALDKASIRERARLYMSELVAFLSQHQGMLVSLFVAQAHDGMGGQASKTGGLQEFLDEVVSVMTERSGTRLDIEPAIAGRVAFGTLLGCITYSDWLFPNAAKDKTAILEAISEFVLTGIGPYSDFGSLAARDSDIPRRIHPRPAERAPTLRRRK